MSRAEAVSAEALFLEELAAIDHALSFACRRSGLIGADAEDFGSYVKVRLIENDYALIRKYEGRSPFAAFIGVVIQRMLLDYRIHQWGRWHASAEAKRLGDLGIAIESMLRRDGYTIDEALAPLQRRWPTLRREEVEAIDARLPTRAMRPRTVALEATEEPRVDCDGVESRVVHAEETALAERIATIVRSSIRAMSEDDRALIRLHFDCGMTIAEVSRLLGQDQQSLYATLRRILRTLRRHLGSAGITYRDVTEIVGSPAADLDFSLQASAVLTAVTAEGEGDLS